MVLCKLHQRRCCYLGSQCRNEHVHVRDTIEQDTIEAINGKQWPLSSYGPFENKSSLPNFIEDQSFEEVRMTFYETKLKNFFGQNHEQYNRDVQEARNKMRASPALVNVAIDLYDMCEGKGTSDADCSGATNKSISFNDNNNAFGGVQFASANSITAVSTANNNNNVFGLPKFTTGCQPDTTTSKPNNTNFAFGITNTTSKQVPLTKPSSLNTNDIFGKASSANDSSKYDTFGTANSASAIFKPIPTTNVNKNVLGMETSVSASSNNLFGKENITGAKSKSDSSAIQSTINNTNKPFGIANSASASSKHEPLNNKIVSFGGFMFSTNNPLGLVNSANTNDKSVPSTSFNNNLLHKENVAGVNSKPISSVISNTNDLSGLANSASVSSKPLTFPNINSNNPLEKETLNSGDPYNIFGTAPLPLQTLGISTKRPFEIQNVPIFGADSNKLLGKENVADENSSKPNAVSGNIFGNNCKHIEIEQSKFNFIFNRNSEQEDLWPDDHYIVKKIDKSIMDLMLVDMLPYSVVDGTAFQRLQFADPTLKSRYKPKTEQFFSATLMPETYNKIEEKMRTMMATTKWISLTIDKWKSSPDDSNLLVTFTAHFLFGSLRKKLVLAAKVLENDQLGSYITEKLPQIINNFKLEEKLHMAVCDNVHNIETAKITVFECVAHTMQLVVNDAIFHKKHVQEILAKCRKIATHFEISKQASEYLENMQKKYSLEKQCLIQDVATNWKSTYLMMKRFIEQKSALSFYSDLKGDIENFTPEEWNHLNDIVQALESIYEATSDLTADTATVSLIIPLIAMLESKLNEANEASQLQNDLKLALNERFKFIETSPLLIMSTLLDPRFKNKYLSITQMTIAEKEITNFLHIDSSEKSLQNSNKEDQQQQQRKANNTLWEKHDVTIETDITFRKELSLYIHEPLTLRKTNIFEYWNTSRNEKLKEVAEKYHSIPPTIVESEQMLRAASSLYADRKAYLKGVITEDLLFCHFNIQLLEFDY